MNEKELLNLKKRIEKDKNEVAEKKGSKQKLMQDLEKKWKCNSLDEAHKKVKELEEQKEKTQSEIDKRIEKLESNYKL